jgi:two-component system response regulator GlrR
MLRLTGARVPNILAARLFAHPMHKRTLVRAVLDEDPSVLASENQPGVADLPVLLAGRSPEFVRTVRLIDRIGGCDAGVLIQGETGTGKELAARAIHYRSARRDGPFIPVNCGAIPDSLSESEFFGHARGAFTGAHEARPGVIAQAERGSLFLDEIETLSSRGQVALLRFLQDARYRPVGANMCRSANVRVLAASNVDLQSLVRAGTFRSDLLFRLTVLKVDMPPLRCRGDDVILLAQRFIEHFSRQYNQPAKPLTPEAMEFALRYRWPGNVRELENLIHREVLMNDGPAIDLAEARAAENASDRDDIMSSRRLREAKAECISRFERAYLGQLLARTHGNISMASRLCGTERSRLTKLVKKYGLDRSSFASHDEPR